MKKKMIIILAATAILLTGCTPGAVTESRMKATQVKLKDGRTVDCVAMSDPSAAISCNWEGLEQATVK